MTIIASCCNYDPKLPVHVQCDAGPNGLVVVMLHIMPNKFERPVIFLSRTLKPAEKIPAIFQLQQLEYIPLSTRTYVSRQKKS